MILNESWYALHVRPRAERMVSQMLGDKGYEPFLPTYVSRRRWSDRVKELDMPLFPGYLFCRVTPSSAGRIVTTQGVIRIVGAPGAPMPVDDDEIDALRTVVESRLHLEPWPYLRVGQRVRIDAGPLCGLHGVLIRISDQQRFVVSVSLLQRSVSVEVDALSITPLPMTHEELDEPMPHLAIR
jgi:transcription termination/antitermination protein NusG